MSLQKNKLLKFLALLLFTMELLFPVWCVLPMEKTVFQHARSQTNTTVVRAEEVREAEESEGNELNGCFDVSEFNLSEAFIDVRARRKLDNLHSKPNGDSYRAMALFKLHRAYQL